MTDRDPLDRLKSDWCLEEHGGVLPLVSPMELERRADKLARQVAWRNAQEWIAAALVVVIFSAWAASSDRWMTQVGCIWTAIAAVWVAWVLARRGRNLTKPAVDAPTSVYVQYQRSQLERQATLLERVPTWYALPLAVGTGVILADRSRELVERGAPLPGMVALGFAIVVSLAVYLTVLVLNRRAARQLRRQLARLTSED